MQPTLHIPYVRFSDQKQERGSSRERQREIATDGNERMGWTMLPYVEDLGASAYHGDHLKGELGSLTARALAGEYPAGTVISAERIDRLSRQGDNALTEWMKDIILKAGLRIITWDDGKIYDASNVIRGIETLMIRMMKAEAARDYSEIMQGRVNKGIRERQAKSAALGRPTCIGKDTFDVVPGFFAWKGGTLVVVESRAEMIRDMYRWSADGMGASSITKRLNGEKRWAWGHGQDKPWQASSVSKYLRCPSVEGDFIPTVAGQPGERIVGYYFGLRIVDADLVKRGRDAAARRSRMKGAGPSADFVNVFQGVSRCGGCLGRTHVQKCKDGKGVVRRYFRCDRASRNAGCDRKGMHPYEIFEKAMLDQMLPLALDDRFFSRPDNVRPLALEVADLEKLLIDTKGKARRIGDRINSQDDPPPLWLEQEDEYLRIVKTTESRLETARNALVDARGSVTPEVHLQRVLEVREAMHSTDREIAMAAARSVRDAVSGVVDLVMTDQGPNGEKSMLVMMANTLITFRVSNNGSVTNYRNNIPRALRGQPSLRLFKAVTSIYPDGVERLAAVVRRMAA